MTQQENRIFELLQAVYGQETAVSLHPRLLNIISAYNGRIPTPKATHFTQETAVLITYGDQIQEPGLAPLKRLAIFAQRYLTGKISTIHLLPFYPYSSDDGFSVIDYKAVNRDLGTWLDIAAIGEHFQLMFDAVINHISSQSKWFQAYLQGHPRYQNFFIEVDPAADLTAVFRPRALPLLTPFQTSSGTKHLWTTFSADQIDLNYQNPDLLLTILETLLFYVSQGAELIRLDAIAFMWKEIGTPCIHLPQTHQLIQLMRAMLDIAAPHVKLITETNVPHKDNISYFGDGTNEAQMVYNFSLPPLTLHAFHTGSAETLTQWASTLTLPSSQVTFFNFLASHDGIGVTPARGILPESSIHALAERTLALGGHVSYKTNPDGSQSAYELNINYLDALADPNAAFESVALKTNRFLASQAIMLALRGVPGIYFHSLVGSHGWPDGAAQTGRARTINREKLNATALETELLRRGSLRQRVFMGYGNLLKKRKVTPAFHPHGEQVVLAVHPAVFAVWRVSPDGRSQALCLHNVSSHTHTLSLNLAALGLPIPPKWVNILDNALYPTTGSELTLTLPPYGIRWLQPMETNV